jgi:uncharacterized protein YndB with AHSA1/START domain
MTVTSDLVVERTFAAPPTRVFAAWSDPELLRRWWAAAPGWATPEVEVDLRVGGRYRLSMRDPEAPAPYTVVGEYLEIDPPRRLVYTWAWETPGAPDGDAVSTVSVDFEEAEGGTRVVLTHRGLADADSVERHDHGWRAVLANLDATVIADGGR